MRTLLTTTVLTISAAFLLPGNAAAQAQASKPAASSAKTQKAPAKKAATGAKTAVQPELKTQKEKFSYALGMNFGNGLGASLRKQSVEFDPSLIAQGMKDALSGSKTRMTPEQAQAVLTEVQTQLRKEQQDKMQKLGEENKKEGGAFLAANKSKPGVVTLPSGLQYKIEKEGTGPKPALTDTVVCNYRGTLVNGTEFDSSYKRGEPATFPVNGVIKGWTEALQLMPVGSKWQLFIPPDLAYGERGAGADIGPNATLIFEVELISIQPKTEEKKEEKK